MSKTDKYYEAHADLAKDQHKPLPFKPANTSRSVAARRQPYSARSMPADYVPIEQTRVTPLELGIAETKTPEPEPILPYHLRD
jgi:hypothetical protein